MATAIALSLSILLTISHGFRMPSLAPRLVNSGAVANSAAVLASSSSSSVESFTIPSSRNKWVLKMAASEASPETKKKDKAQFSKKGAPKDFSAYSIGQQIEGKVVSAKAFGVFVDISNGVNVLLPRSVISRGNYERLKKLAESKSKESVKVELLSISAENQTISAKYINPLVSEVKDIKSLEGTDYAGKSFNATVVGVHDFGLFCEIDEYQAEGLVPATRLPDPLPSSSIQSSYSVGSTVVVQIEDMNIAKKKLTLSMKSSGSSSGGDSLADMPPNKWFQGVVQSVMPFGLIVRPAGKDITGLVHSSKVPFGLTNALKKLSPLTEGLNKTDVEQLFAPGDVIRCRLNSYNAASNKLELAMTPYKASDDEDDYIVEGRDPEGEEDSAAQNMADDDEDEHYDPEDTLLWWRGAPYTKASSEEESATDEEADIVLESTNIIEGTWRRMFELDMREDAADFSSKLMETEMKELEEEIGELSGLDDELIDSMGFGTSISLNSKGFGAYISNQVVPESWKSELGFFKEVEANESERQTRLRAGKKSEQDEFEKLLREVELELEQAAAKRGGPRQPSPAVASEAVSEAASSETPVDGA